MSEKKIFEQSQQQQQQHHNPGSRPFIHYPNQAILGSVLGQPKASVATGWELHQ